jgi:regulator of RNase E activity RraB
MNTGNFGTPFGTPNSPLSTRARPSTFKRGGKVLKSGMAHVDKGEEIIPAPKSPKTTRTSSVLDTQDELIKQLTENCHHIAHPQGKYIMLPGKGNLSLADDEDKMDKPDNQE